MAQGLRVGVKLPAQQASFVMHYLGGQPLLPTWELSVVIDDGVADRCDILDLIIASPQLLDWQEPRAPAVLIIEQINQDDLTEFVGAPSVRGIVLSEDPPETLTLGIAAAASHGVWLPQTVWEQLDQPTTVARSETLDALTFAEYETLTLVALGMTNDEIARARHVQPSTIKYHVDNLRLKTGASSRLKLVVVALRLLA